MKRKINVVYIILIPIIVELRKQHYLLNFASNSLVRIRRQHLCETYVKVPACHCHDVAPER